MEDTKCTEMHMNNNDKDVSHLERVFRLSIESEMHVVKSFCNAKRRCRRRSVTDEGKKATPESVQADRTSRNRSMNSPTLGIESTATCRPNRETLITYRPLGYYALRSWSEA